MIQNDNDLCEYSYYIENYYQCVITGEKCIYETPDSDNCLNVRDNFLKNKGGQNNASTDE